MFDQLREPGVVHMASQIARLNMRVPEARNQQQCRNQMTADAIVREESGEQSERQTSDECLAEDSDGHSGGGSGSILHG